MKNLLILLVGIFALSSFTTIEKPAYRLFTGKGKPLDYHKMLKELAEADVVFFGEQHNDPIAHWLQLEVAKDLFQKHGKQLLIGTEMWETDTQAALDSFLSNRLDEPAFLETSRAWPNYRTDYRPIFLFAKEQGLRVIATNAPRRSARQVARHSLKSLDTLSASETQWLALLPLTIDMELPGYQRMRTMFSDGHGAGPAATQMIDAQALKDATMAHFISRNLTTGQHLLHLNGAYHTDHHEGILWYLRRLRPELKLLTISTVLQTNLEKLEKEHLDRADFILAVPETMTRTY